MLFLVDLDNTLVDRAAAFNSWSIDFVRLLERPDSEAAWLIESDRDGYEPRDSLARAIKQRFQLDTAVEDLVHRRLSEHVDSMTMGGGVKKALTNAKEQGWKIAVRGGCRDLRSITSQEARSQDFPHCSPAPGFRTHQRLDGR